MLIKTARLRRLCSAVVVSILFVGCTTDGAGRYRVQSIGQAQRSVQATVLVARPAWIAGGTTGTGAAAGALAGAGLAAHNSDNAGIIIAGIIGGILVGNALEGAANVHEATEYVIQTETGATFTVAQINAGNPLFAEKDRVILVYGYPSRLIPLPQNEPS